MDLTRISLIRRIREHGNSSAWREFDSIYRPMLLRFARKRGLSEADAEDVVQHCMAALQGKIAGFEYDRSRGRFKSWLRTLVNNRIRNMQRDRHDRIAESGVFSGVTDEGPTPEEAFDKIWMQEHLHLCLRQVRQDFDHASFHAFRLYVLEGRPVEQVCAEMNITANQLYGIKWRITQKLKEKMVELLGEEAEDDALPG